MKSIKNLMISLISFTLSLAFAYAFYIRYYKWHNLFNELGRCYNPDGSDQVYTTSGIIWALPFAFFLIVSIIYFVKLIFEFKFSNNHKQNNHLK